MRPLSLAVLLAACSTPAPTPEPAPVAEPAPVDAPATPPTVALVPDDGAPFTRLSWTSTAGEVVVEPIIHGTLRFRIGAQIVLVDPWGEAGLAALGKADVVLITDVHADHLDAEALVAVSRDGTQVVGPPAVDEALGDGRVTHVLANGESATIAGLEVLATPMYNLVRGPSEGAVFHEKGRGNGYLITLGEQRVYVAGDTECTPEMRALTDVFLAFIPMNLPYTMPPEEAAECVRAFRPTLVVPYHHRDADLDAFDAALRAEPAPPTRVIRGAFYP